jgi:hypothetical protein
MHDPSRPAAEANGRSPIFFVESVVGGVLRQNLHSVAAFAMRSSAVQLFVAPLLHWDAVCGQVCRMLYHSLKKQHQNLDLFSRPYCAQKIPQAWVGATPRKYGTFIK